MDPDATLEWILRLRAALDASLEASPPRRLDRDAVYTLVGLVDELDRWLRGGHTPPARWSAAFRTARTPAQPAAAHALVLDTASGPSNDTWPGRRRALARRRSTQARAQAQLVLPFAAPAGS